MRSSSAPAEKVQKVASCPLSKEGPKFFPSMIMCMAKGRKEAYCAQPRKEKGERGGLIETYSLEISSWFDESSKLFTCSTDAMLGTTVPYHYTRKMVLLPASLSLSLSYAQRI